MSDEWKSDPLAGLSERLLDAGAAGRFAEELSVAQQTLDTQQPQWTIDELIHSRVIFFDLALVSSGDRRLQARTGIDLLGTLVGDSWDVVLGTNRIADLHRLTDEPELGLELLELLSYAPDSDVHDAATSQLESIGMRRLLGGENVRSIERLLHAAGASEAAYRLEAARKQYSLREHSSGVKRATVLPTISYRVSAIAGGHPQLRASAAAVLEPYGVTVVSIPSSREAVRRERGILQALQGSDLVVLLVRQITHSTSDQVRKAAERLSVPVLFSHAASAVAIERQLLELERATAEE
jgi:hypothetical protein